MIIQLLKPHYWMLDRTLRGSNRYWLILLIMVVLFVVERIVNAVSLDGLSADSNVALLLFGGLFGVLLLAVLDINHTLHQLFESHELDILMVNPVPLHTIYALKLVQCSRTILFSGPLLIGVLLLAGIEGGAPLSGLVLFSLFMASVYGSGHRPIYTIRWQADYPRRRPGCW